MPKRPFAETILAMFAGRERASAIYGDLTEMAVARGRLWFAAAYLRTLISLGWRSTVSALIAASTYTLWIGPLVWRSMRELFHPLRHAATFQHAASPDMLLGDALLGLFFLLPFLFVRFGIHDRLTQLACVLFILTLPYFSLYSAVVQVIGPIAMVSVTTALFLRPWRRPMTVLLLALVPQCVLTPIYIGKLLYVLDLHGLRLHGWTRAVPRLIVLALTAVACVYLHRRLIERHGSPTDRDSLGVAHA